MWRNDQPRVASAAEEIERALSPQALRPTNITLTIRRKDDNDLDASGASARATDADNGLDSSVAPYIVALHVLRDGHPASLGGVAPPDDPTSVHFAWPAPPAPGPAATSAAHEGAYFVADALDGGSGLGLSAWNGPAWSSMRNGIDDMVDYVAVVEFQGGMFLASEKRRVEVVQ
jgi:hypothetical protein